MLSENPYFPLIPFKKYKGKYTHFLLYFFC